MGGACALRRENPTHREEKLTTSRSWKKGTRGLTGEPEADSCNMAENVGEGNKIMMRIVAYEGP